MLLCYGHCLGERGEAFTWCLWNNDKSGIVWACVLGGVFFDLLIPHDAILASPIVQQLQSMEQRTGCTSVCRYPLC